MQNPLNAGNSNVYQNYLTSYPNYNTVVYNIDNLSSFHNCIIYAHPPTDQTVPPPTAPPLYTEYTSHVTQPVTYPHVQPYDQPQPPPYEKTPQYVQEPQYIQPPTVRI
jgi:hypothetical protein